MSERPAVDGIQCAERRAALERSRTAVASRRTAGHAQAGADVTAPEYAAASLSANTVRAYRSDLRQFARWLAGFLEHEFAQRDELDRVTTAPVPPEQVAAFLIDKANAVLPTGAQRYTPGTIAGTSPRSTGNTRAAISTRPAPPRSFVTS